MRIAVVCGIAFVLALTVASSGLADYGKDGGQVTSVTADQAGHVTVNWTHPPNDPNLAVLGVGEEIETDAVWIGPAGTASSDIGFVTGGKTYEMPPNDDSLATFTTPDTWAPGSYEAIVIVADYERFDGNEWLYCPWNGSYFECKIDVTSAPLAFSVTDTTAPTSPGDLHAKPGQRSVTLTWDASTDNVGVLGYHVYRDGHELEAVDGTSFTDTGLAPRSAHHYEVAAYDQAGNVSARSQLQVVVPAAAKPKVTAICKDGTKSTKPLRRTACAGHRGVRRWLGSK